MTATYTFPLTATLKGDVAPGALAEEIKLFAWGQQLLDVTVDEQAGAVTLRFDPKLTDAQVHLLKLMLSAHRPIDIRRTVAAAYRLGVRELPIGGAALVWQLLDGIAIDPTLYSGTPARLTLRVVGQVLAAGDGAELQIVEQADGVDEDKLAQPFAIPDTRGQWQTITVDSDVRLRIGQTPNLYSLQGRLGKAAAASIRFAQIVLLWV